MSASCGLLYHHHLHSFPFVMCTRLGSLTHLAKLVPVPYEEFARYNNQACALSMDNIIPQLPHPPEKHKNLSPYFLAKRAQK
jgi:hypothetical protein